MSGTTSAYLEQPMHAGAVWLSDPMALQPAVAFGNLVDLARLQLGSSSAEVCDACNTVNLGSARYCKGCAHKLPAFYAAGEEQAQQHRVRDAATHIWQSLRVRDRASMTDFAVFSVVVNLLVAIAELAPVA
ncbi:MAG: hypothetical protein HOQ33_11320 [Cupriavidus sp.]|jgi:hypothetical protein|nr:hypothetical protein [Cupriavidus sp.]